MFKKIEFPDNSHIKIDILSVDEYPWHYHDDAQLICVMDGEIELKESIAKIILPKNGMHFIHKWDVHGMRGLTESNVVLIISFDNDFFKRDFPDFDAVLFNTNSKGNISLYKRLLEIKTLIFSMLAEFYKSNNHYTARIDSLAKQIITILYESFRGFSINIDSKQFETRVSRDEIYTDLISKMISTIYEQYPYKLSLHDIAEQENLSEHYLSRLFHKYSGNTFTGFLGMARCEMSEIPLLETDDPITKIAFDVGFSNNKYYVSNFKDWFGYTPKEYRTIARNETIDHKPIKSKELSIHAIQDLIDLHHNWNESSTIIKSVSIHMNRLNTVEQRRTANSPIYNFYSGPDAHADCVSFCKDYITNIGKQPADINLIDTLDNSTGAIALNRLKKPIYYFLKLIDPNCNRLLSCGYNYIVNTDNTNIQIVAVNDNTDDVLTLNFGLLYKKCLYQITTHTISEKSNGIELWKQRGIQNLSSEDVKNINRMSAPTIDIEITPDVSSSSYTRTLKPKDIIVANIKPII